MAYIFFPSPTPIFPVLPPLAWPVHKKALMASRTTIAATGREARFACCAYPRWEFTLTYGGDSWLRDQTNNITTDPRLAGLVELQELCGLFLQCRGSYGEFYYSDPDDNSRLGSPAGTGNGTNLSFPIFYTWGTGPFPTSLTAPVGGIQTLDAVYLNGSVVSPTTYALDAAGTQIVFTTAPGSGVVVTADFVFYFRCRFLDDTMSYSQFSQNLWEVKTVKFESVKP